MAEEQKKTIPGEAALQNMKLLKSESSIFKVPKVPKKKDTNKTQVLDEELYVKGIAKIIQRDFFPDLEKLNAQNEFLEATENKDYARLREITRKYSGHRPPTEPYNSPATFDTPDIDRPLSPPAATVREHPPGSDNSSTHSDKPKDFTDNHTLDSFLATHTSEDNASYDRVIALEHKKRASKLAPQFEAEQCSIELAQKALALPSIEEQADQMERPHELATWVFRARNHIMYVPEGAASQAAPPPPGVTHHNTRLAAQPFDHAKSKEAISAIAKTHGANISGKIGVDGASVSGVADKPPYELVATPSPRPGAGPDASPLMTWGEIEGTPFRLDGGDTPLPAVGAGAAYRMLESGSRERLALQLAERAARTRRPTTPRHSPRTRPFRTNTERLASMSPAARMLATKHLLSPRLKLTPNDVGVSRLTPKLTPKPTPKTPLVTTPGRLPVSKKTTPIDSGSDSAASVENDINITDNLLQINVAKRTRLRAQDLLNKILK